MMFRHPKYYKELRKLRNKSDQAISQLAEPVAGRRAPGQGQKQQAIEETVPHNDIEEASRSTSSQLWEASFKPQAARIKLQATSVKPQANLNQNLVQVLKLQAASIKRQATSVKLRQATSNKLRDSWTRDQVKKFRGPLTKGLD